MSFWNFLISGKKKKKIYERMKNGFGYEDIIVFLYFNMVMKYN